MNRPSMGHTDSNGMNRSSRIMAAERIQQPSSTLSSPSVPTLRKRPGSRENLRSLWQRLSSKKLVVDDNKKTPQELQQHERSQYAPKKGCLKVLTLEASLLSCSDVSVREERSNFLRKQLTSVTDDISCCSSDSDDEDDDLYGEWEATPIISKPTTVSFGTINVHVFSSSPDSDGAAAEDQTTMKGTIKHSEQTDIHISVDEYEMKRPSGQRKVLCKKNNGLVAPSNRKSGKHTIVLDWKRIRRSTVVQTA